MDSDTRQSDRLVLQALRERWPIPEEAKAHILERILAMIDDPESSPRLILQALKGLKGLSQLNLDAVRAETRIEEQSVLIHLAERDGKEPGAYL